MSTEALVYFIPMIICWILSITLPILKYKNIMCVNGYDLVFVISFFIFILGMIPLLNILVAFMYMMVTLDAIGNYLDRKESK
jgi:hypothetical protein